MDCFNASFARSATSTGSSSFFSSDSFIDPRPFAPINFIEAWSLAFAAAFLFSFSSFFLLFLSKSRRAIASAVAGAIFLRSNSISPRTTSKFLVLVVLILSRDCLLDSLIFKSCIIASSPPCSCSARFCRLISRILVSNSTCSSSKMMRLSLFLMSASISFTFLRTNSSFEVRSFSKLSLATIILFNLLISLSWL